MNIEAARVLSMYGEVKLEESYYGRGMSNSTAAVHCSVPEMIEAVAELFMEEGPETTSMVLAGIRNLRTDNLGNDTIFY